MIEPYYEEPGITIYNADCLDLLWELEPVDMVLTDPPYDLFTHKGAITISSKKILAKTGSVGVAEFDELTNLKEIHAAILAVVKTWAIVFCSVEMLGKYQKADPAAYIRGGIWDRISPMPQLSGDRPAQPVEGIAILHNPGRKVWNGGGRAGIWRYGVERGQKQHPTQKPLKLIKHLLLDFSTSSEQTILDPFMGSGTTLVAAKALGRPAIGIEIEKSYCDIAIDRLRQGVLNL